MARQRGENGIKRLPNGNLQFRTTYTDASGARRSIKRQANTITEIKALRKSILRDLEDVGERALSADRITFQKLAEIYRERKLIPAKYVNGRKVEGLRSLEPALANLRVLVNHFGRKKIKSISASDIEDFKSSRLATPTRNDLSKAERTSMPVECTRSIAAVNRELELLRAILNFAKREGWISRSPFELGASIISKADETRRDRVLSHEEEVRLLKTLDRPRRRHLLPFIVTALDTSARRGELFKLRWSDVDFEKGIIHIRATNTKTQTERFVGMTERLEIELRKLRDLATDKVDGLVFGLTSTVKTGLGAALREAGIDNFRLHDSRHTAITRMVNEGLPSSEIMKASGHTQITTFQRYVNPTEETARKNAMRLSEYNRMRLLELDAEDAENKYVN